MNIVLETTNVAAAYWEKRDWMNLGYIVRATSKRKVYRGGFQTVYRVWVGNKRVRGTR